MAQSTTTSTDRPVPSIPSVRTSVGAQRNGTATAPRIALPRLTSRKRATPAEPRLRQLMGVCGWAAVLGGIGLVIGIRDLIAVVTQSSPGWFEPVMSAIGLVGIALTVGGFLTVHRRRAPWIFLGGGSAMLIAGMIVTSAAL